VCARPVENKCFGWKGNEREEDEFAVVKDAEIGNTPLSTRRSLLLRIVYSAMPPSHSTTTTIFFSPEPISLQHSMPDCLEEHSSFDEGMYLDGGTPESHSLEHLDSLITLVDDCKFNSSQNQKKN